MDMETPDRWKAEALTEIFARTRPEIERLFRLNHVSPEEAEVLLDDTLTCLLLRWEHLTDPEQGLLERLRASMRVRLRPVWDEEPPVREEEDPAGENPEDSVK